MAAPEQRKRQPDWKEEEIYSLIYVWSENLDDLRRIKRNRHIYMKMEEKLQKEFGVSRAVEAIKNKMESLTKLYKLVECIVNIS